jgi:glycosyltransferase involved in cell wall biosynthesis
VLQGARWCFADGHGLAAEVESLARRQCLFLPTSRRLAVKKARRPAGSPPYRLAFLGRWHPNKGIDLLLEALEHLSDEDWAKIACLRIHGGGPLAQLVHQAGARLQARGLPVSIGGYLDGEDATALLEWTDYTLIPSRIESIPVVFSDAMQAGRPVLATPVGDLPTLVGHGGTGVVAHDASASGIAEALRRLLRSAPHSFQDAIAATAAEFDISRTARSLTGYLQGA